MQIGKKNFDLEHQTYIMGILNVTPDSFSDGGRWNCEDDALAHAEEMIRDGAAILDVGGESTRPGHTRISDEEEIARVVPVIRSLKAHFDIPISIDTYKSEVARAALDAGADLVNDIWGLKADDRLGGVIARYQVPCCLMHNRATADYRNFMEDVLQDLRETLALAEQAGISRDRIILDPGVGFATTREQDLTLINHLGQITALGYPVLLGASRKRVVGTALDLPVGERVEGTMVTTVFGVQKGASLIRVHDVKENYRAMKMTRALMSGEV